MSITLTKLKRAMSRAIRRSLNKPFGPITEDDTRQMDSFLSNVNGMEDDIYEVTCDHTNNTLNNMNRGIVNITIKLKIAPEDRYNGF